MSAIPTGCVAGPNVLDVQIPSLSCMLYIQEHGNSNKLSGTKKVDLIASMRTIVWEVTNDVCLC